MTPTWAVDWDHTCVEGKWPAMGDWLPGAVDALRTLSEHGRVRIHTCRIAPVAPDEMTPHYQGALDKNLIRQKLDAEGLFTVEIHDKPWKPPADAYVDDKGVHYNGRKGAWKALVPKLLLMAGVTDLPEDE